MSISKLLEYFIIIIFARIISLFGIRNVKIFAYPIAYLFYFIIPIRKKVVKQNLRFAFPEWDSKKINKTAFHNYVSFAITFLEIMALGYSKKEDITGLIECKDIDRIKQLIGENKGAILLTAHFGNWELGALVYGIELGHSIDVLAKRQKNRYIADRLRLMRERFGNKEVLLGSSVRDLYKALLKKGIVGIVADQRAPKDSCINVKFFDRETPVFAGPATIALKTKSPILVVLVQRNSAGVYEPIVDEIKYDDLPIDPDAQILEITQRYMNLLERAIRQTPEQWFWMHKIWKRQLNQ